jgi:hypothetical protein
MNSISGTADMPGPAEYSYTNPFDSCSHISCRGFRVYFQGAGMPVALWTSGCVRFYGRAPLSALEIRSNISELQRREATGPGGLIEQRIRRDQRG